MRLLDTGTDNWYDNAFDFANTFKSDILGSNVKWFIRQTAQAGLVLGSIGQKKIFLFNLLNLDL